MEGLLTLLIIGLVFFLMMRFGCGAHMMHGGHGKSSVHTHDNRSGTDPVCFKEVPADSGFSMAYLGKTYRFCSRECLNKFDREPNKYLAQADLKETS